MSLEYKIYRNIYIWFIFSLILISFYSTTCVHFINNDIDSTLFCTLIEKESIFFFPYSSFKTRGLHQRVFLVRETISSISLYAIVNPELKSSLTCCYKGHWRSEITKRMRSYHFPSLLGVFREVQFSKNQSFPWRLPNIIIANKYLSEGKSEKTRKWLSRKNRHRHIDGIFCSNMIKKITPNFECSNLSKIIYY